MKLTGTYKIKSDKNSVWKALNDPEILKKSIPGCENFKKNTDTNFTAVATNKIGPFNATFTGDIELKDLNPPDSYKIIGQGNSPVGFATGEAEVKLIESDGITTLTYIVEANVGGKIAQVGSRLIDMTAKKMADIFFGNFSESFSSPEFSSKQSSTQSEDIKEKLLVKKQTNIKLALANKLLIIVVGLVVIGLVIYFTL
tara:strand:+ start:20 stop:616 length:597 start_codon:yes stop_codon:yes gene_type:complete